MRLTILLVMLTAATASSQIVNGKFETGTLAGWTVEIGQQSGSCGSPVQWVPIGCDPCTPPPCPGFLPQVGWCPAPGISIYDASDVLPFVDMALVPDPWEGSYMAQLNDTVGQFHTSRLSQTFTITAADLAAGGLLGLEWGAILEDPGHDLGCQPWFQISVAAPSCSVSQQLMVDATDAANQGWLDVALPSTSTPFYYKHDVWCVDLSSCAPNTSVTVQITAADCTLGQHGGVAFLDNVRFLKCTPTPLGMVAWWRDDSGVDSALANDYAKIGMWFGSPNSGKVGSESAMLFGGSNHAVVSSSTNPLLTCHQPSFHFDANQGFAMDMWVRPISALPFYAPLIHKSWRHVGVWVQAYDFHLEDRYLALTLLAGGSGGFSSYVCTDARVALNEWTHVAVSVDRDASASEVRFYINGERRDSGEFSTDPTPPGLNQNGSLGYTLLPDMFIGYSEMPFGSLTYPNSSSSPAYFRGRMDEIEFFNRALTDSEVYAIFQSGCRGKCVPQSFTDYLSSLPGASGGGSLPAFPPGTIITDTYDPGAKLVTVSGPPGGPSTTSTWDGREWTQTNVPGPMGLTGAMTFDRGRRLAVAIGGDPVSRSTEVWEWSPGASGGAWSRVPAAGGPPELRGHAVAYDSVRRSTLVFGGDVGGGGLSSDTWSWNGSSWNLVQVGQHPPARHRHAMVFDEMNAELVVFGGLDTGGNDLGDTWTFDGSTWTLEQPTSSPSGRSGHSMAFDRARGCVVLYGGTGQGSDRSDTWEWNGADWKLQNVTNEPPARHDALMAFDDSREKCVVMAGSIGYDGMWYYGSLFPAQSRSFGASCPGLRGTPAPALAVNGHAWLGRPHELVASTMPTSGPAFFVIGFSNSISGLGALPLNLAIIGLHPTCHLLVDPFLVMTAQVVNGSSPLPLLLPFDPTLLGLVYYSQVIGVDQVNVDLVLTNGVLLSIGRR